MRNKIQIGIACGYNCEHYVNFLIDSVRKTISGDNDIQIILGVNRKEVNISSMVLCNGGFSIRVVDALDEVNLVSCSECHGRTLDVILQNMDSKYGMFVDCDCAFLEKGWDNILLDLLIGKTVIVGSEYDGQKYMNFPNIVGCLFKTQILKDLKVSLVSADFIVIDENNSQIYSRIVGDRIMLDVGWELCYKLKTSNYDGIVLPLVRTKNKNGDVESKYVPKFIIENMRGEEYQLNGVPILTHVGRSSIRDFLKDPIVIKWRNRVEEWIANNDKS